MQTFCKPSATVPCAAKTDTSDRTGEQANTLKNCLLKTLIAKHECKKADKTHIAGVAGGSHSAMHVSASPPFFHIVESAPRPAGLVADADNNLHHKANVLHLPHLSWQVYTCHIRHGGRGLNSGMRIDKTAGSAIVLHGVTSATPGVDYSVSLCVQIEHVQACNTCNHAVQLQVA
jgi:hypothetical protein